MVVIRWQLGEFSDVELLKIADSRKKINLTCKWFSLKQMYNLPLTTTTRMLTTS